jgi:hypothetical protein
VLGTGEDVSPFVLLTSLARCSKGLSNEGLIVVAGMVRIPMVASGIEAGRQTCRDRE